MKAKLAGGIAVTASLVFATIAPALADSYTTGVKYYSAKHYIQASGYFEAALRENPAHSSALYYDASCYQMAGQAERARALYQLLLSVFPNSAAAPLARRALSSMGGGQATAAAPPASPPPAPPEAAAAQPALTEEAVIDDEIAKSHALVDAGRQTDAERLLVDAQGRAERLGSLNPRLATVLGQLGDFYYNKGDSTRACREYRRELQINERLMGRQSPALADRMTFQSNAFLRDGDPVQAELLLRQSVDIYQTSFNNDEHNHLNTKTDSDKLVGALGALANVLRNSGKAGEAKIIDGQVRMLTAQ